MRSSLIANAWLWGGVFLLLFGLSTTLVYRWLRRRGRAPQPIYYGTRPPPPPEGARSLEPGQGGKCPRCRRAFEAGVRFCPMDAEELVPLQLWQGTHPEGGIHVEHNADHLVGGQGKICPVCAARYDLEAGYCARDASELVTVN